MRMFNRNNNNLSFPKKGLDRHKRILLFPRIVSEGKKQPIKSSFVVSKFGILISLFKIQYKSEKPYVFINSLSLSLNKRNYEMQSVYSTLKINKCCATKNCINIFKKIQEGIISSQMNQISVVFIFLMLLRQRKNANVSELMIIIQSHLRTFREGIN